MDGTASPAFGCRSLAEMTGLDHGTVARLLRRLRDEGDPLIELIEVGRGKAADRYQLRVPRAYQEEARWIRWRKGLVECLHPALHQLGPTVALVYEALSSFPTGPTELTIIARLPRSTVREALRTLGAYALAERRPDGWVRGTRSLEEAAVELGGDVARDERHALYVEQRKIWHKVVKSWEERPAERDHADWFPSIPWPSEPSVEAVDFGEVEEPGRLVLDDPSWTTVPWPELPSDGPESGPAGSPQRILTRRRRKRSWPVLIPGRSWRTKGGTARQEGLFELTSEAVSAPGRS
jgi:hypothetical protein